MPTRNPSHGIKVYAARRNVDMQIASVQFGTGGAGNHSRSLRSFRRHLWKATRFHRRAYKNHRRTDPIPLLDITAADGTFINPWLRNRADNYAILPEREASQIVRDFSPPIFSACPILREKSHQTSFTICDSVCMSCFFPTVPPS